jgi:hypothetical protein
MNVFVYAPEHATTGLSADVVFSINGTSTSVAIPLPQIAQWGLTTSRPNRIRVAALNRTGLHVERPLPCRWPGFRFVPPDWTRLWTRGQAHYFGAAALKALEQLRSEYVPGPRARGARGIAAGPGRELKEFAMAAVIAADSFSPGASSRTAVSDALQAWPVLADLDEANVREFVRRELATDRDLF